MQNESPAWEPPLVGRAGDLTALRQALQRAESGRAQMVLIEGEAGMGKSALLQAFLRNLQSGTGTGTGTRSGSGTGARQIWSVRCDPFEQH